MLISENTFQPEFDFLFNHVPEALYLENVVNAEEFFTNYFQQETLDEMAVKSYPTTLTVTPLPPNFEQAILGGSKIAEATNNSIQTLVNIAIKSMIELRLVNFFVDLFGKDAYGCYLPMHKFFLNKETPWGIYLFPEMMGLPSFGLWMKFKKEINFENLIRLYIYCVYRHELFHFQTEFFATGYEVSMRKPFYKPYHEKIYKRDSGKEWWFEEALAEASVLESRLVKNRSGIKKQLLKKIYKEDLKNMPAGYRDYACKNYGGPENAHRILAAQILHLAKEEPNPTSKFTVKSAFIQMDIQVPVYMVTGLKDILSRAVTRIQ